MMMTPSHKTAAASNMLVPLTRMNLVCIAVAGLGGMTFGYDLGVIVGTLPDIVQELQLNSTREGLVVGVASVGQVLGAIVGGWAADRLGRKVVMFAQCAVFTGGAVLIWRCSTLSGLLAGRFVMGLGFAFSMLSNVSWLSEIVPSHHRGRATSTYELCVTIGVFLALLTNMTLNQSIGWRPFFLGGAPIAVLQCIALFWLPESPSWCFLKGRDAEAADAVARVGGGLKELQEARKLAESIKPDSKTLSPLKDWRVPLVVALCIQALGLLTGGVTVRIYAVRIYQSVGISQESSAVLAVFLGVAKIVTTLGAVCSLDSKGRRWFYMLGMSLLAVSASLLAVAGLFTGCWVAESCGYPDDEGPESCQEEEFRAACPAMCGECPSIAAMSAVFGCTLGYAAYQLSFGPVNFALGSELFPPAIRARFLGLQVIVQGVFQLAITSLFPLIRTNAGLTSAMLFHTLFCLVGLVFITFFTVETSCKDSDLIRKNLNKLWGC